MIFQVLPDLSSEDYAALKADIAERGVQVAIEYDEHGNIIDGHHRIKICDELGLADWPRIVRSYVDDAAKRTQARKLNLARRHLDQAAKRALVEADLKDRPDRSNRQIAAELGVDDKTVGAARDDLERRAEIPHVSTVTDTLGRVQPTRRPTVASIHLPDKDGASALRGSAKKVVRGTEGTGDNQWFTPDAYLKLARDVLGGIDLDPASHNLAQERVRAAAYFTERENGLIKHWHGRVWLNPPYAQPAIEQFCDKLITEIGAERVSSAIMLTHNYTDTSWFQKAARAANAICFTRGRIRFESPEGELASPTQGQAFSYFGTEIARFVEVFSAVGFVVEVRR